MEARAKFDRPPLGGPSHSSASNDAGVAQAVAAAARQAGVAATPTAPSSAQMANHEQYYNQQRANAAQAHSTAGAGAAASVAAAGAGDDAHNATTAEDSGHGGLSSSVRNMYRQLNNTNIFHAMSVIHEEKQVKDLSKFHDRKPMLYGSIALFSYIAISVMIYTLGFDWTFVDSLYFVVVTLTTVGYGDQTIATDGEKVVTIFVVFIGVGLIGAALGIVAGYLVDKADAMEDVFDDRVGKMGANLLVSMLLIVLMLAIGTTAAMLFNDDMSFLDAVYFSSVTVTTVGYGDLSWNASDGAKIFGVFYLIFGTIIIAKALSDIASIPLERRRKKLEKLVMEQYGEGLSMEELQDICGATGKGFCTKNEFVLLMLQRLDKIKAKDVAAAAAQFDRLDIDKSGVLSPDDVESQFRISTAKNNAAAAVVGVDAFDDGLEAAQRRRVKTSQVAPGR